MPVNTAGVCAAFNFFHLLKAITRGKWAKSEALETIGQTVQWPNTGTDLYYSSGAVQKLPSQQNLLSPEVAHHTQDIHRHFLVHMAIPLQKLP